MLITPIKVAAIHCFFLLPGLRSRCFAAEPISIICVFSSSELSGSASAAAMGASSSSIVAATRVLGAVRKVGASSTRRRFTVACTVVFSP